MMYFVDNFFDECYGHFLFLIFSLTFNFLLNEIHVSIIYLKRIEEIFITSC